MMKQWAIGVTVILVLGVAAGPSMAADSVELKLGILSAVGGLEDQAVNRIAEVAAKNSNGRIKIKIFPAAQLGNFISQMESVLMGGQDVVWGDLGWLGNFVKDYQILIMPYAFRSQAHMDAFMDSPLGMTLEKQLNDKGYLLPAKHAYQLPKVVVSKKPVNGIADVQGIKMRVPEWPISIRAWEAMGTKPVKVTWGEVYLALSQGVADALECGFEFIFPSKFHEVAKFVARTNHAYGVRGPVMSVKRFNSFSKEDQKILSDAFLVGEKHYNELVEKARVEHQEKLVAAGVKIVEVDTEAFKRRVIPIVDEMESKGFWGKGLFNKIQAIK